jgi:lysyl-tRNA synthetase, class II
MGREKQIVNERRRKIKELEELRINPYPYRFDKKQSIDDYLKSKLGTKVKTAGRLMTKRDLGKIAFAKLKDSSGEIQIVFQDEKTPGEVFKFFKKYIDTGDFIGIEGKIFKTKTKETSVLIEKIEILSKAILPLPEKFHGLKDKEERYRKRYLDLIMNFEVKEVFEKRAFIIDIVRDFLKKREFLEVETPALQSVYGGASARPFETNLNALKVKLFLSISPEIYLKKLIVGGFERVFTICKNFRNEGIDQSHNPEFTMMEYYVAYEDYNFHIKFTEELFDLLRKKLGLREIIEYQGKEINLKTPFKKIKFRDLLIKEIGIDIDKVDNFIKLKEEINKRKIKEVEIGDCRHYGALLDEIYKRVVRPRIIQPTFLTHYPVEMIALAKRNEKDPRKINTVQLIIDGVEIVKSYDELNDPVDQEERLKEQASLLKKGDNEAMPMDEDFINSLKVGMPPTAGYGLGIDRLVMLLTNQPSIRDVILFPFMRPEK